MAKEFKLNVPERIILLGLLPPQGDVMTIKLVRELREALSFNDEENKSLKMVHKPETGSLVWDGPAADKIGEKDVEIGETMEGVIKELLKEKSDKKELTEGHLTIWEKFMG